MNFEWTNEYKLRLMEIRNSVETKTSMNSNRIFEPDPIIRSLKTKKKKKKKK